MSRKRKKSKAVPVVLVITILVAALAVGCFLIKPMITDPLRKTSAENLAKLRETLHPRHWLPFYQPWVLYEEGKITGAELVTALLASYEEETGLKGEPISTGGGTYAKVLKQGVAFGALFPDEEDLAHQADEYATVDRMMTAMKVFANALVRLAGE